MNQFCVKLTLKWQFMTTITIDKKSIEFISLIISYAYQIFLRMARILHIIIVEDLKKKKSISYIRLQLQPQCSVREHYLSIIEYTDGAIPF